MKYYSSTANTFISFFAQTDSQDKSDMPGAGVGKTILVTGGGGYIGSHCVHELLVEDYNVVAVDNFVNSVPGKAPLDI